MSNFVATIAFQDEDAIIIIPLILLVTTINPFIFMQHYGIHTSNGNLQLEFNQRAFYQVPSELRRNLGASAYREKTLQLTVIIECFHIT